MRQHLKRTILKKMSKSEEIFHLSSTQYSQNIEFYNDLRRTTNFFIIIVTPMRQYLKRIAFKQNA